jgi:hypothetical protein
LRRRELGYASKARGSHFSDVRMLQKDPSAVRVDRGTGRLAKVLRVTFEFAASLLPEGGQTSEKGSVHRRSYPIL